MLRAGPFSDERIVRLVNRRFVPFYFDLSTRGFAGDAAAREFVVAVKKELGNRQVPTPPVLFMTPDGELLGEQSNYATEEQMLASLLRVLKEHPEYNEPGEDEKRVASAVERARIAVDLQDFAAARKALAGQDGAHYMLARLDRFENRWVAMEQHLAAVRDEALADDVRMERAYLLWHLRKYERLAKHLADFPKESNRFSEARYYEGLALFHAGRKDDALEVWESTVTGCSQDPWIYRADWAYCNLKREGGRGFFSSGGPRTSKLNRIGYMGRRNPDLKGPR